MERWILMADFVVVNRMRRSTCCGLLVMAAACFMSSFASIARTAASQLPAPIAPGAALKSQVPSDHALAARAPRRLRCDLVRNPLGVQNNQPLFTWTAPRLNALLAQRDYQIQVADSRTHLLVDHKLLWNSGKTRLNPDFPPRFGGPVLRPFTIYYWHLRVWGTDGWKSGWSKPASWRTGPLRKSDWRGQWITYRPKAANGFYKAPVNAYYGLPTLIGANWILSKMPHPLLAAPGLYLLQRAFTLPAGSAILHADMLIAADDYCKISINGHSLFATFSAHWRKPVVKFVGKYLHPGRNVVTVLLQNGGKTGNPAGVLAAINILGAGGYDRRIVTDTRWQAVKLQTSAGWASQLLAATPAIIVKPWGAGPWGRIAALGSIPIPALHPQWLQNRPSPIFRHVFVAPAHLRRACLFMAGLGYWVVRINGKKVGSGEIEDTNYNYSKASPYQAFDVSDLLHKGQPNVMTVALGNGWYNVIEKNVWGWQNAPWRHWPRFLLNVQLKSAHKTRWISTGPDWRAAGGPWLADNVYAGEVYDAAQQPKGWNNPAVADRQFPHHAQPVKAIPSGPLTAQLMPSCRVLRRFNPLTITEPLRHIYVVKFPQNMSGWVTLTARGRAGVPVVIRYGEQLYANGTINRSSINPFALSGSFQTDTYIPANNRPFTYHPEFAYNGFQYVQIYGVQSRRDILAIHADFIHTPMARTGNFACGNPLLNAIARAARYSYQSNFVGYPTDCPTREKNGWTADAWVAAATGLFTYNNTPAYAKWLNDFARQQSANGNLALIIPSPGWQTTEFHPDWESAYEQVAWFDYVYTGNGEIIRAHYNGIKRFFTYMLRHCPGGIAAGGGWEIGDWVSAGRRPDIRFVRTCLVYRDAVLLARMAAILGKKADQRTFVAHATRIRRAFNAMYYKGRGVYENGGQTAQAMPLYFGLVPARRRIAAADKLVADVHAKNDHLSVGLLGDRCLFRVLSRFGHTALAYRIATQTTYPSYGLWFTRGATTLWEEWDGGGSHNHIMFGDILGWMYNDLAGIKPDSGNPGFRTILISPHPVRALPWASATYKSHFGNVACKWQWHKKSIWLNISIPPAASGVITLPGTGNGPILCNGRLLTHKTPGVIKMTAFKQPDPHTTLTVAPGKYWFAYHPRPNYGQ